MRCRRDVPADLRSIKWRVRVDQERQVGGAKGGWAPPVGDGEGGGASQGERKARRAGRLQQNK